MSYMEIYNENIRDLLNPNSGYLDLRDDIRGRNVQVSGLTEVSTNSTEEVFIYASLRSRMYLKMIGISVDKIYDK